MRCLAGLLWACAGLAAGAEPVVTSWILSPAGGARAASILPDVQAVEAGEEFVTVRSAGLSLRYLGPLESAPVPVNSLRSFAFRIPRHPVAETGRHARLPAGVAGAFLNGMPIYNQFETLSFNGANIWHYDRIALNDDGTLTAAGRARPELTHPAAAGLLEQLREDGGAHSPLLGFALDGYPVYGPWGRVNGALRRMRSGYRVRRMTQRHDRGDGVELMPGQYGPDVSAENPLGTFAEDYEYVAGSGELDEFNGRYVVTPEYPGGTYAYFLSTDERGRWAFPYAMGPRSYGRLPVVSDGAFSVLARGRLELSAGAPRVMAGVPVRLRLRAVDKSGEAIRHFEYVHEKPIHLIVVSDDLAEFDHIHPELMADDSYEVSYLFAHGGKYRLWADYSLPGEAPRVEWFEVMVGGAVRKRHPLVESSLRQKAGSVGVELVAEKALRAGEDIPVTLKLSGEVAGLEPYLGAWAHVIVIGEDLGSFAHAHPLEAATSADGLTHSHAVLGPAPGEVHVVVNFAAAGLYCLWAQFQLGGEVVTAPFVLRVGAASGGAGVSRVVVPEGAVRVLVTAHGYEPAKVAIPANRAVTLAFSREVRANCGAEVVFPALGIRREIPLGGTVLVEIPAQGAGEIAFACGMGMFRGVMVAR